MADAQPPASNPRFSLGLMWVPLEEGMHLRRVLRAQSSCPAMQFAATNLSTPKPAACAAGAASAIATEATVSAQATIPKSKLRTLNVMPSSSGFWTRSQALCSKQCLCRQLSSTRIDAVSIQTRLRADRIGAALPHPARMAAMSFGTLALIGLCGFAGPLIGSVAKGACRSSPASCRPAFPWQDRHKANVVVRLEARTLAHSAACSTL